VSSGIPVTYLDFIREQLPEALKSDPKLFITPSIQPADINTKRVSLEECRRFLSAAINISEDEAFILKASSQQPITTHGAITLACLSSPTALDALKVLEEFISINMPYCLFRLTFTGESCNLAIDLDREFGEQYQAVMECILIHLQNLLKEILVEKIHWANIEVDYAEPTYAELYTEYFHCPVNFGAKQTRIQFPLKKLQKPLASANSNITSMAQHTCRQLLKSRQPSPTHNIWREKVLSVLDANQSQRMTLVQVASILNISPRTLQRHLSYESMSFHTIQDERTRVLADIYLRIENMSVEKTAILLGYSSATNMRRSFRRWFGVTPQQYRDKILLEKPQSNNLTQQGDII
jgi:AraC-like DNA-binding protein